MANSMWSVFYDKIMHLLFSHPKQQKHVPFVLSFCCTRFKSEREEESELSMDPGK